MGESLADLPAYLLQPPVAAAGIPAQARIQELPYESIGWENFERLCLRCARAESDVERAHSYGNRGQEQYGIDLYARLSFNGAYRVYQCKNVTDFTPAKIESAVTDFLGGKWADTATEFVLCTRESLRKTKRSEEFERQFDLLKARGVKLIRWDADELNNLLKDAPKIVVDFFGREWARAFCGDDKTASLGQRLDVKEVNQFRHELGILYRNIFSLHDRGLPLMVSSDTALSLHDRYVLPDVLEFRSFDTRGDQKQKTPVNPANSDQYNSERGENMRRDADTSKSKASLQRIGLEDWLCDGERHVIVADFGLGKSSLLRFLALDLLDEAPRMKKVLVRWGQYLPVWVPFALWTRLLSKPETSAASLSDMLRRWLQSLNEERLWPLVEQALNDDRLLLLVDGFDEWADETAAGTAAQRLELFVAQHKVPVVGVGRPAGYSRLSMQAQGWKRGRLAGFSETQQQSLAQQWIGFLLKGIVGDQQYTHTDLPAQVSAKVNEFMTEVKSPEIAHLAEVPLLLSLLVYLKLQNMALPDSRFKAYDKLIQHVISEHPKRRRIAAGVSNAGEVLSEDDATRLLGYLAYVIQRDYTEGSIPRGPAIAQAEVFLKGDDGLGFTPADARQLSKDAIDSEGASTGLLVERTPEELGFFHRSFQEYLAAQHVSRLKLEEQTAIMRDRCVDARWHEVILGVLNFTRRPDDVRTLIEAIERRTKNSVERRDVELLLCQIAAGDYNCRPPLARRLVDESIRLVETDEWMPHRERVLERLLRGLRLPPLRDQLRRKLSQWFPGIRWRRGIYEATADWSPSEDLTAALFRGLHDEEISNQRTAGVVLAKREAGNAKMGDRIAHLSFFALNIATRCAALETLVLGWPKHPLLLDAADAARASNSEDLMWAAIFTNVHLKRHTDDDFKKLFELGKRSSGLEYSRKDEIADLISGGWSGSAMVRSKCFEAIRQQSDGASDAFDANIAIRVLLTSYPRDTNVALLISQEIQRAIDKGVSPFIGLSLHHMEPWRLIARNFKDDPAILPVVDSWISARQYQEPELAFAALVGRTEIAKTMLIDGLKGGVPHWAAWALIEGWGTGDPDVGEKLRNFAQDPSPGASRIGHLFPKIIGDRVRCKTSLVHLLANPDCNRPDFVLRGLAELEGGRCDAETCGLAIKHLGHKHFHMEDLLVGEILIYCSSDVRTRNIAIRELWSHDGNSYAVARAFGEDPEIRSAILNRLSPLPTRLREVLVNSLGESPRSDEFATSLLRLYDMEHDQDVKARASIYYYKRLDAQQLESSNALQSLREGIACYGFDLEERRQAALCGLITINRLDIIKDAKEQIGADRPHSIPLSSHGGLNFVLLNCLAQNWHRLRDFFQNELPLRFVHEGGLQGKVIDALSIVAPNNPLLHDEVLNFLEAAKEPAPSVNNLQFIARVRPRSQLLRSYCMAALRPNKQIHLDHDTIYVAADTLADHFGPDRDVHDQLTEGFPSDSIPFGILFALCKGWPNSEPLRITYEAIKKNHSSVTWDLYFALICRFRDPKTIIAEISEHISQPHLDQSDSAHIQRIISRRALVDKDLQSELATKSLDTRPQHSTATFVRLLAEANGLDATLREKLLGSLDSELAMEKSPAISFDLFLNRRRALALTLLDVLAER